MALGVWILGGLVNPALGQAECTAWGNLTGIRIDGQLMEFETSLRVVAPDWSGFIQTAKERRGSMAERGIASGVRRSPPSTLRYPATLHYAGQVSGQHPASSIQHPASNIQHPGLLQQH